MTPTLTGANLIASQDSSAGTQTFTSTNPRTNEQYATTVHEATSDEVAQACVAAREAFRQSVRWTPDAGRSLLSEIAAALDGQAEAIVELADSETALGVGRLEGELQRTTNQLRFLGDVVADGAYLEAIICSQEDDGSLRRMLRPLGPVAVFGASNFPLAFSVAGGDTAAALAVGCPVVVKAHPSHPLTSEFVGRIITGIVAEADVPAGMFSLVHGFDAGQNLVLDPNIKAVGFTGSFRGGTALMKLASQRDQPIPVYAEMGSLNPVVVSPAAAQDHPEEIAAGFIGSFTLSVGQFCTKPGLLFVPSSAPELVDAIVNSMNTATSGPLLNAGIHQGWDEKISAWSDAAEMEVLWKASTDEGSTFWADPVLFAVDAATFASAPELREECFGPASILVRYDDDDDLAEALDALDGNLAAGVHAQDHEDTLVSWLLPLLEEKAGRLIWNGWPTGVAVTWAMHHGGPFPATSNPLHTSVGATALRRFLRPVCYQGIPDKHLPPVVQEQNPLSIPRRDNGELQTP